MDSTIPAGASKNPFRQQIETYVNLDRDYHPNEYIRYGSYAWVPIPQQIKTQITASINKVQNLLLPTLRNLSNQRNISQIQEKVYHKLLVYEDEFNNCQVSARTNSDAYKCGNTFISRLNDQMPGHIKKILDEY